jgi:pimeloyl-ACP methyl ester carboxylesterase
MTSTATWTEHDLNVVSTSSQASIHYARLGTRTGPPLMLLHGFSDAGLCWLRLASDLASDYDLILPDAAGHGRTSAAADAERLSRAVADPVAVLDALGIDRVTLIGHSMGAATAAAVAGTLPERVRGVVLEDPPWRDGPWQPTPQAHAARGSRAMLGSPEWVAWIRSVKTMSPEQRREVAERERGDWPAEDRPHWIEAKAQFNIDAFTSPSVPDMTRWREAVRAIQCPTLLITGDVERGAIVTPEVAEEARGINPKVRVVHVPGAGHNIRREQYAPLLSAVREFLGPVARA